MAKKLMSWKTKGMNRDLSVSAFNPEFAFESINLRLSTNEGNTMMSWVNEKGTKQISLVRNSNAYSLAGTPIGTAVLNDNLVIFTHGSGNNPDHIYKLKFVTNDNNALMSVDVLYDGNLNFSTEHPLETMVDYEADYAQKVYWTDGKNQPRLINIAATSESRAKWAGSSTCFDFVPTLALGESVTITQSSGGIFAPGVIQYCFTYINKYGQQSNIAWSSTLYYLTHTDRGASPEEKVGSSFMIEVADVDMKFDYLRLYSIQRTSLDATPYVRLIEDLPVNTAKKINNRYTLSYLDDGTTGASIDPTELLYVGGKEIAALTMVSKNQTLFLGNLTLANNQVSKIQDYYDSRRENSSDAMGIYFKADSLKRIELEHSRGIYSNTHMLNMSLRKMSTFKGGETYRMGFQLQKKTGEWTEPIFMKDTLNGIYPKTTILNDVLYLSYAEAPIDISVIQGLDYSQYKKVRPVIVYPTMVDRTILCQGVINPTVFSVGDRMNGSPYAQASWFFRPNTSYSEDSGSAVNPKISVTTEEFTTGSTPDVNPEGQLFIDNSSEVYVLLAEISNTDTLNEILTNQYISILKRDKNETSGSGNFSGSRKGVRYSYKGVISLGNNRYLFIRDAKDGAWPVPYGDNSSTTSISYSDITYIGTNDMTFLLYNNLSTTDDKLLYYRKPEDWPASYAYYVFKFYVNDNTNTLYRVVFTSVGDAEYFIPTSVSLGSPVRFKHYDSLYCDSDVEGEDDGSLVAAKQIEIQGSYRLYDTPFSARNNVSGLGGNRSHYNVPENREPDSSTQFFVDQSIVTLNSPDIDFDTVLQSYGMNDIHLRIVGAVPITASSASHSIQASSMLEMGHNIEFGGTRNLDAVYGSGERNVDVLYNNVNANAARRLVSEYLWNDTMVFKDADQDDKITSSGSYDYLIHPWQMSGSLNTDARKEGEASSVLQTKKEASLLYSINTEYLGTPLNFDNINTKLILTENSEVFNTRLPRQSSGTSEVNYYANIDKVLYNEKKYYPRVNTRMSHDDNEFSKTSPISMKYKSTSHAVIAINSGNDGKVHIMPRYGNIGKYTGNTSGKTFWDDTVNLAQDDIAASNSTLDSSVFGFLWLGELYKEPLNRFGGTSKEAVQSNNWVACGNAVNLVSGKATIRWTDGDTFFQRYDCLKTYPYTNEDKNQLVEILSFMCETHINIDGRYDKNRGQRQNYNMSPKNFNILNPVYSQQNNFFTYKKPDLEKKDKLVYPNQIFYSKAKTAGADVDLFTNVTLASILELDGDKGQINALEKFDGRLYAFQDSGISQILYDENTVISTSEGVPVEIANSGKVQGKVYRSESIGCSNKWSIAQTPKGLYFMDSMNKDIYLFNGQLQNISTAMGFNSWVKNNIPAPNVSWDPTNFKNFIAHYDKLNQDILFINKNTALAFSEKLGMFTSFYDYGATPYFCSIEDAGIWIGTDGSLWRHQAGDYCKFFGINKPYSMTLVGNSEPQADKVFTNLEFRAIVEGDGTRAYGSEVDTFDETFDETFHPEKNAFEYFKFHLPFDSLETWNEYQHGIAYLSQKNGRDVMKHHLSDNTANLTRKFRIWRCDIPRDNYPLPQGGDIDTTKGIARYSKHPLDRMRNPWLYLKLQKNASEASRRTEIHDLVMTYFD